jgi:pyocin large subunit-like protein
MVITRSELECMRILRINLTTGAYKVYYGSGNVISNLKRSEFLENIKNTAGNKLAKLNSSNKISEVNVSSQSNNLMDREEVIKNVTVSGAFFKIFNGYKKIWKKILFIKD